MDIKRLKAGSTAPQDSDCIKITKTADGSFELLASALLQCSEDDEAVSEAVIGGEPYGSYEEAERAGVAWAEEHCVELLYVETA